jgi:hypothetical protein
VEEEAVEEEAGDEARYLAEQCSGAGSWRYPSRFQQHLVLGWAAVGWAGPRWAAGSGRAALHPHRAEQSGQSGQSGQKQGSWWFVVVPKRLGLLDELAVPMASPNGTRRSWGWLVLRRGRRVGCCG